MKKFTKQLKIAAINDLSGFGRCSLTVSIPIISAFGIQCCPLPTAILSNHTGYKTYTFDDYTDKMDDYFNCWQNLNLKFNTFYTGFLGSKEQIEIVSNIINIVKNQNNPLIITDPVMGDHGKLYSTFTQEMCDGINILTKQSDVIVPNLTECCILCKTQYREDFSDNEIFKMAESLRGKITKTVIVTGVKAENEISNFVVCDEGNYKVTNKILNGLYSGTGDVFASVIASLLTKGENVLSSVTKASDFVYKCVEKSIEKNINLLDGVCFEEFLSIEL